MTLIETTRAHVAAQELAKLDWPFRDAREIFCLVSDTREDAEFFFEQERRLVEEYAARDESGLIKTQGIHFEFAEPGRAAEYERRHRELESMQVAEPVRRRKIRAPERIRPELLGAVYEYLDFDEGD